MPRKSAPAISDRSADAFANDPLGEILAGPTIGEIERLKGSSASSAPADPSAFKSVLDFPPGTVIGGVEGRPDDRGPDAELLDLGAQFDAVVAFLRSPEGEAEPESDTDGYSRCWDVREKINAIGATTIEGLAVKARTAEYALRRECDTRSVDQGPGGFVQLSKSIAADVLALASSRAFRPASVQAGGGDAELLDIGRRWEAAEAEYEASLPALFAAENALEAASEHLTWPPEALKVREDDQGLLGFTPITSDIYSTQNIKHLRNVPRRRYNNETAMLEPWPEGQVRADEIVAAYDAYVAAMADAKATSGYAEAEATNDRLCEIARDLRRSACAIKPSTIEGLKVKLRMVQLCLGEDGLDHAIESEMKHAGPTAETIALGAAADAVRLLLEPRADRLAVLTDPVFKAIAAHRDHASAVDRMTSDTAGFNAAAAREGELWKALCETEPQTLTGTIAFARYVTANPDLGVLAASDGPQQALQSISAVLARLERVIPGMEAPTGMDLSEVSRRLSSVGDAVPVVVPPQYRWREPPPLDECGLGDKAKAAA